MRRREGGERKATSFPPKYPSLRGFARCGMVGDTHLFRAEKIFPILTSQIIGDMHIFKVEKFFPILTSQLTGSAALLTGLPVPMKIAIWKSLSTIAPPLFYIVVAEKDRIRLCKIPSVSFCRDNNVHAVVI